MNTNDIDTIQLKFGFDTRLGLHNAVMAAFPEIDETTIDEAVWAYCKKENENSFPEITFKGV